MTTLETAEPPKPTAPDPLRANIWSAKNIRRAAVAAAVLLLAAAMVLSDAELIGGALPSVLGVTAMALAIGVCFSSFGELGETRQRAHYKAWYWGGQIGLCALVLLALFAAAFGFWRTAPFDEMATGLFGKADATTGFVIGFLMLAGAQVAGYALWFAVSRLARRS